jgi:hypothetical protein
MYANNGMKVRVPPVNCSDDDCFLDFNLRVKNRMKYPGACSLYYQSAIQAVYELLGWDPVHNRSKGVGIFGLVDAIGRADEEQDRGTLHAHILVWLRNFAKLMKLVFHSDADTRESAREALRCFVDRHFNSSYEYEEDVEVVHEDCGESGTVEEMFSEADLQDLRDCRHRDLLHKLEGKILTCKHCKTTDSDNTLPLKDRISTVELNDMILKSYATRREPDPFNDTDDPQNITFPLSSYRMDLYVV